MKFYPYYYFRTARDHFFKNTPHFKEANYNRQIMFIFGSNFILFGFFCELYNRYFMSRPYWMNRVYFLFFF